ncbi:MAG TPA: hypothetical protein PK228_03610 [Saprospiraceae bacterium]|nr:hypothetical protein [Saprospiraceae bacterium]
MRYTSLFRSGLFLLLFSPALQGQNDKALLHELMEENKKSVEALALYPPETRVAVFEAAKYPEVLIKMNGTRQKTAAAFRALIEDFPQSSQQVFYDLVRYPGLVQELVEKKESPAAMQDALKRMPENQRDQAFDLAQNNVPTLLKITELDRTARSAFDDLIAAYPAPAQAAFRHLAEVPEVLEILNEDLRLTILVGDLYREDPAWVIRETDSLNLAVVRAHAEELDAWKKTIENDPEAQKELQAASREYAQDMGYEDTEDYQGDDVYYEDDQGEQNAAIEYQYPWWFGYPWWYPYPCWRPYPWWYDWGFYYYPYFSVVYMPSWYFMDWYFYYPYHHYHYNHLSSHFVDHYYGHRRSGTTISTGVGAWRERNRAVIPDEWMKDKARLPQRMKEYGQFEEERQKYNAKNPKSPVSQEAYLEKNARKYPELQQAQVAVKQEMQREAPQTRPSEWAPRKDPAPAIPKTEPARAPKTEPAQKPQTQRPPRNELPPVQQAPKDKTQKPAVEQPRTTPQKQRPAEEAKDYHRQKWDESERRQQTQRQPAPAPAPRTQPQAPRSQPAPSPSHQGGRKN